MKIAASDEYGLRILIRITREGNGAGLSIPKLSEKEQMSQAYVGKITRQLRIGGLIESTRGQKGGYVLARPAAEISIAEVIRALDGPFFDEGFCSSHSKDVMQVCTNSVDCSIRSLWKILQYSMDKVLANITLEDLCKIEDSDAPELIEKVDETILN
jgi:Rrf2 family protein